MCSTNLETKNKGTSEAIINSLAQSSSESK